MWTFSSTLCSIGSASVRLSSRMSGPYSALLSQPPPGVRNCPSVLCCVHQPPGSPHRSHPLQVPSSWAWALTLISSPISTEYLRENTDSMVCGDPFSGLPLQPGLTDPRRPCTPGFTSPMGATVSCPKHQNGERVISFSRGSTQGEM